jgi:hypothetical protein
MTRHHQSDRNAVEARFAEIFAHLDFISTYARRRGARDPDGIAAGRSRRWRVRCAGVTASLACC